MNMLAEGYLQSPVSSAATVSFITVLGFMVGIGVVLLVLLLGPQAGREAQERLRGLFQKRQQT